MVTRHVKEISEKIRELQFLREHLLALGLRCTGHKEGEPCGILEGLEEDARTGVCHCGVAPETDANAHKMEPLTIPGAAEKP